jgi:hypothetical protein
LLSDTIQSSPGLNFGLTLIEMKLFSYQESIILIPDIVGKTREVVRGVVKVQYVQEKPKLEVMYAETEESQSSITKTDRKTFISECPTDIGQIIDIWLDKWLKKKGLLIYWGVSGFSVRKQLSGKWTTMFDVYPYAISLITLEMSKISQIPSDIYDDYIGRIFTIEEVKSVYSRKKRYIKFNTLDTNEVKLVIEATGKLIDAVLER